ncbi:f-box domain containing [Lecanosticta acicola]|uniref:F-box domain containing n=1 Tax=Lecanosticta acicola TaxID=111012 RepID=A0AAI8YU00_9PEZI|nr:f-box domain containing [Lecanosticta acicola]
MADNNDASTTIVDLPPELIVRVGSYLTTAELGPLRRSCKQIEASLFDNFASEFFTKRQFMVEHHSLEALVGIANHSGLASRLTEVLVGTQILAGEALSPQDDFLAGRLTRDMLLSSGMARDMLADAFSKLPNLRIVGLRDYDGTGRIRDGPEARWRSWGWNTSSTMLQNALPESLLPLLISALDAARARPENLEVILRRYPLKPKSLEIAYHTMKAATPSFLSSLRVLFLTLQHYLDDSHASARPYDEGNPFDAPLKRFMHSLSSLEHLRLNFRHPNKWPRHFLDWLGRPASSPSVANQLPVPAVQLPNLTSLELGMATVTGPTLVRVLTKFDLKLFSLWRIAIEVADGTKDYWSEIFAELSNDLPPSSRLRTVKLGNLSQAQKPGHWTRPFGTYFVPEGTQPHLKKDAQREASADFKAQFTGKTVHQWLKELSERTWVPDMHLRPDPDSDSDDGGADSDDVDGENEDDDEDEEDE